MKFRLLPILDIMIFLYGEPPTMERFNKYLELLGKGTDDLILPLGGFNPMAKEHVLEQLLDLKTIGIESIISETLEEVNKEKEFESGVENFEVAFNLSDDLKGGWTNRYISDYLHRFKLNPLVKRKFCVPVFWTSEVIDENRIRTRTREMCYRVIYFSSHSRPKTVKEHLRQEVYVASHTNYEFEVTGEQDQLQKIYELNEDNENEVFIKNFLYGDGASSDLGNIPIGITENFGGLRFAAYLAKSKIHI